MLKLLRLAVPLWLRECRRGQWTILLLALVLAVTAISSIHFMAKRIEQGLIIQSTKLLGGNLVIESSVPIPTEWAVKANELQLKSASIVDMQTMASHLGKLVLINLQAVSNDYPLVGNHLLLQTKQALVDARLLNNLALQIPADIKIGTANFQVPAILPDDIEISYTGWLIAPRVLIKLEDLAATQILLPGSRANYRLLTAGSPEKIAAFRQYVEPLLTMQQRLLDMNHQQYSLLSNFNQIEQYIQLIVLFCLLMCGVAISLSVRQYVQRHHQNIALWRCLGATASQIRHIYLVQFLLAAILSGIIGLSLAYVIQSYMIKLLALYFPFPLPAPGVAPYAQGILTSFIMLFCFAYPVIQSLPQVKPLELWRDDTSSKPAQLIYPLSAFCVFILFTCWLMNFTLLSLFIIDCIAAFIATSLFLISGVFSIIRRVISHTTGVIRRGLGQLIQFPETSGIQIGAFSIVLIAMLILQLMKVHLLDKWQDAIAKNAPNYFAFNIASEDIPVFNKLLSDYHLTATAFFPMIKGRLITVNQQPVFATYRAGNSHNALHRDLNLSSSLTYPTDNKLIAGKSWNEADKGKPLVSVESSLATALQLKIGDELGFLVSGKTINATVSNIRKVNWTSFHPNFYVIFTPGSFANIPATYIVSFFVPADKPFVLSQMMDKIPNMTIVDMADTLQKIQVWIKQATTAIQGLFFFSLFASVIVFIAAILTTMDERRHTYRLIHILGGGRRYIIKSLIVELAAIFSLTLLFSYSMAAIVFYVLVNMFQ